MARFEAVATLELKVCMTLAEDEAHAISELAQYNTQDILKVLGTISGRFAGLGCHGQALERFFGSIKSQVPGMIQQAHKAREIFKER